MKTLDKNRFKEVFKQYYNPLCNFAASILKDKKLAEDVVHDVFEKLWDKRSELNINDNEKSYLFTSVRNKAIEVIRKNKSDQKLEVDYINSTLENGLDEVSDKYLLKEKLYRSIRQLPPKCQKVFLLNKINGLTYIEIADDLDISVKTVENHMGKAFRLLREMMKNNL